MGLTAAEAVAAAEAAAVAALLKSSMGLTSAGEGGVRRAELVLCRLGALYL